MLDIDNIHIFKNNKKTLKETSKNKHDDVLMFMTESTLAVVDFDDVKKEYSKNLHLYETPCSNDALFIDENGHWYFIEFKNCYISNAKLYEIQLKIFDSLLLFTDIIKTGISFTRENMTYILVYNEKKNPSQPKSISGYQVSPSREEIARHFIERKAKKKYMRFNLWRFEKLYFKEVFTLTESLFDTEFVSKFSLR